MQLNNHLVKTPSTVFETTCSSNFSKMKRWQLEIYRKLYEVYNCYALQAYQYWELQLWRDGWSRCHRTTIVLHGALEFVWLFPNVHHLLQLGCMLPVTSCDAERSSSASTLFSVHVWVQRGYCV